jgi:hypothetical protein
MNCSQLIVGTGIGGGLEISDGGFGEIGPTWGFGEGLMNDGSGEITGCGTTTGFGGGRGGGVAAILGGAACTGWVAGADSSSRFSRRISNSSSPRRRESSSMRRPELLARVISQTASATITNPNKAIESIKALLTLSLHSQRHWPVSWLMQGNKAQDHRLANRRRPSAFGLQTNRAPCNLLT